MNDPPWIEVELQNIWVFAKICGRFKHFDAAPERPALRADACFSRAGERSTRRLPRCPLSHPTLPFPRRENRGLCGPFGSASGPYFPGGFERAARETHPRILARRQKTQDWETCRIEVPGNSICLTRSGAHISLRIAGECP